MPLPARRVGEAKYGKVAMNTAVQARGVSFLEEGCASGIAHFTSLLDAIRDIGGGGFSVKFSL